jgi:membrane protease YdiL (CAAX protease family)
MTIGKKAWYAFLCIAALGWSASFVYKAVRGGIEGDWLWPALLLCVLLGVLVEEFVWPKLKERRRRRNSSGVTSER